jgi:histidyl-tRNA synthetase
MQGIEELEFIVTNVTALELQTATLAIDVTLARGLNYYTGAIFEVSAPHGISMGSIGGGGRYDDLTGIFGLKDVSGVGISFGLDRIYLVLEELGLFPQTTTVSSDVLFFNFGETEALFAMKAIKQLRNNGISAELYPDIATNQKKERKQLTYAERKEILYVVLIKDQEIKDNTYTLKNMQTGDKQTLSLENLIEFFV